MKYFFTFTIVVSSLSGIALYGIAYGAQNSVTYVKETPILAETIDVALETAIEDTTISTETNGAFDEETSNNNDGEGEAVTPKTEPTELESKESDGNQTIYQVPFYSQFSDISAPEWKKIGCGIASLAMLIDFYKPGEITVDGLLDEGISADAYIPSSGWSHAGLIGLAKSYGLSGEAVYMADQSMSDAFHNLETTLKEGPVMVSVHYTFQPTNPIPHLVIVTGVDDEKVHYNDPAEESGNGSISIEQFQSAWKKRYIALRP